MKTLFIIVSAMATLYLAMQTTVAKTALGSLVMPSSVFSETSPQMSDSSSNIEPKTNPPLPENAAPSEPTNNGLDTPARSDTFQIAHDNTELLARISVLEANIVTLQEALSEMVEKTAPVAQAQVPRPQAAQLQPQAIALQESTAMASPQASQENTSASEQNKRRHQQAVLRALSQRMELAALSSLSN